MWCAYVVKVVRDYFTSRNYDVYRASMVYDVRIPETGKFLASNNFWREEQDTWFDDEFSEYWVDVYKEYSKGKLLEIMKKAPFYVSNIVLRLNYTYNNKKYKYISNQYPSSWPIPAKTGFKVPLKEARLIGDLKTLDVTSKVKRYAGPDYDFHGEEINVRDLFFISLEEYDFLEITNILNKTVKFSVDDKITLPLF